MAAGLLLAAVPAHARIVLHHDGRHAWPAGPIPAPWRQQVPVGYEAGYSCETFGVLWTDLATWDCRPCLIHEEAQTSMSLEGAPAAMIDALEQRYAPGDVRRGLWELHGRWALLMVAVSVVGAISARRRRQLEQSARVEAADDEEGEEDPAPEAPA